MNINDPLGIPAAPIEPAYQMPVINPTVPQDNLGLDVQQGEQVFDNPAKLFCFLRCKTLRYFTRIVNLDLFDGGDAPNIVPESAQVYYYVRHPQSAQVLTLFERVVTAARAGAMGTGTTMTYEVMHGNYPVLRNDRLARLVYDNLIILGGLSYTPLETQFAEKIRKTLLGKMLPLASAGEIQPFFFRQRMGSTDVGDVSWKVPTVGFGTATWVPGTPAHSWQAVASGGTSIGHKGMLLAAKLLAVTAQDLYQDHGIIDVATEEFNRRRGVDFVYESLLGDRDPPLDYRQ